MLTWPTLVPIHPMSLNRLILGWMIDLEVGVSLRCISLSSGIHKFTWRTDTKTLRYNKPVYSCYDAGKHWTALVLIDYCWGLLWRPPTAWHCIVTWLRDHRSPRSVMSVSGNNIVSSDLRATQHNTDSSLQNQYISDSARDSNGITELHIIQLINQLFKAWFIDPITIPG